MYDTPDSEETFFHAVAHQMKVRGYLLDSQRPQYAGLHYTLMKKTYPLLSSVYLEQASANDIQNFSKALDCIVAVAQEDNLNEGFTYHYSEGETLITKKGAPQQLELPPKDVYYVVQSKIVRPGNVFEKEPDIIRLHFKSVISSPLDVVTHVQALPTIFEAIPYYRGSSRKFTQRQIPHIPPQYCIISPHGEEIPETIRQKIQSTVRLLEIDIEKVRAGLSEADYLNLEKGYIDAQTAYYQDILDKEKNEVEPVLQAFLDESKERYDNKDLVLSPARLNRLVKDGVTGLDQAFYDTLGANPLARYLTYYIQARYIINHHGRGGKRYFDQAKSLLLSAKDGLIDGMNPWNLVYIFSGIKHAEYSKLSNPENSWILESSFAQQLRGRLGFFQGLHQNIHTNIDYINKKESGDMQFEAEVDAFSALGVIESDDAALKANGIATLSYLIDLPPEPSFGDLLGMAVLGIVQVVGGALLICTGAGVTIGASLLSDGIQDIYQSVKSGITKQAIDWASYWVNKGLSFLMSAASAAYGAVKETAGASFKGFGSEFSKNFIGKTTEVTSVAIKESAKKVLTQATTSTIGRILVSEAMGEFSKWIMTTLKKDIAEASKSAIQSLNEDSEFMEQYSLLSAFEYGIRSAKDLSPFSKISADMFDWSQSSVISKTLATVKTAINLAKKHHTNSTIFEVASYASQLAVIGYSAGVARSFAESYVAQLKIAVKKQVIALPTVGKILCDLSNNDKIMADRWVRNAQASGVIRGEKPYVIAVEDKDGICITDPNNLLRLLTKVMNHGLKINDPDYIRESSTLAVSRIGWQLLTNFIEYYKQNLNPSLDIAASELKKLWMGEIAGGVLKESREFAMRGLNSVIEELSSSFATKVHVTATLDELNKKVNCGETLSSDEIDALAWAKRENTKLHLQELESLIDGTKNEDLKKSYQEKADSLKAEIQRSYNDEAARVVSGEREAFLHEHGSSNENLLSKLEEKLKSLEDEGANPHVIELWKQLQQQAHEDTSPFSEKALKEGQDKALQEELEKLYPNEPKSVAEVLAESIAKHQSEQAAEHARRHRDPEPGSLPAVASGRAPVGVDSSAAVENILQKERVKEELAGMFTPQQMKEVVDESDLRQRLLDPMAMTAKDRQVYAEGLKNAKRKLDLGRKVRDETGSNVLGGIAVLGQELNEEVWQPIGEVIGPVVEAVGMVSPIAGAALEGIGQGVHWVEGKVGDGLTRLTGSQTFGDAVAPTATQGILAAAPKVPGALRTTGRVVKQTAEVLRNLEVTLDSSALLRHNAGIPIDAIKIGQKTPKVDVPTTVVTTEGATAATVNNVQPRYVVTDPALLERVSVGTEGYQCRICPITGKGPLSVDSTNFTVTSKTNLTKTGAPRDSVQFWKHFREKYDSVFPEIWSETNLGRLNDNYSPRVDEAWLRYFPEHSKYMGETLEHHHIDHGNIAIPLPETMHKGKLFNRMNHHQETYIREITE